MNICVIATASHRGGALAIYNQFLSHLEKEKREDEYYILVAPNMPQRCIDGVRYIIVNTSSSLKRIVFDLFNFKRIIHRQGIKIDVLFSLQNTAVRCDKSIPQFIYYHQSLPFFNYGYNLLSHAGRSYFFYHYLYPFYVKLLSHGNVGYIVQTDFIKDCFERKYKNLAYNTIYSCFPDVEDVDDNYVKDFEYEDDTVNFIYPAIPADYKEHDTLSYALSRIEKISPHVFDKIRIHLTFKAESYPKFSNLVESLHQEKQFVFHGRIGHEQLLSMFKSSKGVLFPSMMETIGLPMLEAAALGIPVVANDLLFVHSVINNYEGVSFIEPRNYEQWAQKMLQLCEQSFHYPKLKGRGSSWPKVFELIKKSTKK